MGSPTRALAGNNNVATTTPLTKWMMSSTLSFLALTGITPLRARSACHSDSYFVDDSFLSLMLRNLTILRPLQKESLATITHGDSSSDVINRAWARPTTIAP